MKNMLRLLVILMFVPMAAQAQWQYDGVFPDSTIAFGGTHGLAVDADSKVWIARYYSLLRYDITGDDTTKTEEYNPVWVLNADGTPTAFSPVIGSMTGDSLLRFGRITGLSSSADGSVIYVSSDGFRTQNPADVDASVFGTTWNTTQSYIHAINATTGEGIAVYPIPDMRSETRSRTPNRLATFAQDGVNYGVVSYVFGGSPIFVVNLDDNWATVTTLTSDSDGFKRSFESNADGTMIFNPAFSSFYVEMWTADTVFDEYARDDYQPLGVGMSVGTLARYPLDGDLLFISGAGGNNDPAALEPWNSSTIYAISARTYAVVDSFSWDYGDDTAYRINRALAFAPDGLTAYLGTFSNLAPGVQKFTTNTPTSIERISDAVVSGYELNQNYPNPFNPSTRITFTLPEAGMTSLKVYDLLGREVATLVNREMNAGTFNFTFDASNLSSGVYLYELRSGNTRLTNKMTLVK